MSRVDIEPEEVKKMSIEQLEDEIIIAIRRCRIESDRYASIFEENRALLIGELHKRLKHTHK